MSVENIMWQNRNLALIVYHGKEREGVQFFCDDQNSLQIGKHYYPGPKVIKPHRHCSINHDHPGPFQEALYIKSGKVNVKFYSDDNKTINQKTLVAGDLILLIKGGHSFEFLEETEMIEVKQGPYNPDSTQRFEGGVD